MAPRADMNGPLPGLENPCQEAITRNQLTAVSVQAKWVGHTVQNDVMCLIFADSNFVTS